MGLSTSSLRYPNGTAFHVDFREVAPAAATEDMYNDDPDRAIVGMRSTALLLTPLPAPVHQSHVQ